MKDYRISTNLPETIFRAYDIRGKVLEHLTEDVMYSIAKAIAAEALAIDNTSLVVARDGRLSSENFAKAAIAGLLDSGIDVIDIGDVPTPLMYFATHFLLPNSGMMITGSHNPADYNGLKIVLNGNTLADQGIKKLYQRIVSDDLVSGSGKLLTVDIASAYIARVESDISLTKPLKIIVDAGNGIAGKLAPALYRKLGCEVVELFCEIDGHFPHHHPDPSQVKNLETLIAKVREEKADLGLAFDGDGDRLGVVTNEGEIIWPDRQMMAFSIEILERHPNATILYDVKCSSYLPQVIQQYAGEPFMWKTGHSYIKNKMKEVNAALAGEMSGHLFFKDRWYGFDDALYAGARMLEIISQQSCDATTFFRRLPDSVNTPELNIPVSDHDKFDFMVELAKIAHFPEGTINTIDGLRVDFPYGFGLVRPSNTTPNLVLRFEANTMEKLSFIQNLFREKILFVNPDLVLPF